MTPAGGTLRDLALFRGLARPEIDALARDLVQRRYRRGEIVFSQGDPGDGLYIIVQGHVSIQRQNLQGGELIIAVCEPGEYFGELALFDDEPRSATAVTMEACTTQFLSRASFRGFLQAHPQAMLACMEYVIRQLRRCTDLADEIALLDVRRRLARRLLRLADQGMIGTGDPSAEIPRMTQQQLADMTGATRESVNKHLNALVDEGILRLTHGHVEIVDRARLEQSTE
ncbi:MAG: Crp/Fnr family transcriptional regulator [Chloroflexota bacterium]